jgi:hypothetical protein
MRQRLIGCLGLSAVLLAVLVGQGLTLTRCLLTGQVMLTCCQTSKPGPAHESTADATDICCRFEHLVAGWPTAPPASRAATPPTLAWLGRAPFAALAEPPSRHASSAAPPAGEPPPIWRSVLRI